MSILNPFQKNLYFWNENEKLDWMDQIWEKIRTQIFAFAFHIVIDNGKGKPKSSRKSSHNVENKSIRRRLIC